MILPLLLCLLALARAYHDEDSRVVWVRCENPHTAKGETLVNDRREHVMCHHALNHFYDKGYELVGHAATGYDVQYNPPEEVYSFVLSKRRVSPV